MKNIEDFRKKYQTISNISLVSVAGFVVAPVIVVAIKGIVGMAVAGIIGLTIVQFAPVISMKFANWKVKGIISEAKENPIETMINLLAAKKEAFKTFKQSVIDASTAVKTFETKVNGYSKQYPNRAEEFQTQLSNMKLLVSKKESALQEAQRMLVLGEEKLEEMKTYWDMSQALQVANKAAGMDVGDMYEKLKADVSVDAVWESMNRSFAELEVATNLDNSMMIEQSKNNFVLPVQTSLKSKV